MATKYFPQTANAETTCDAGVSDHDLSKTQGSSTTQTSDATASESYVEVLTFDLDVSADTPATGDVDASIDVTDAGGIDYRFRVQAIDDSGCAVDNSTSYTTDFTGEGIKTLAATNLTWAGTSERLRLSIEIRRQTGLHGNKSITINVQDADTFINASWTPPAGDPDIRPDADISNTGNWTEVGPGTTLWEAIDEETPDESTSYITVTVVGAAECEVGLENIADPVSADDHVIHIRGRVESGSGTIKVELIENTTIRATLSATALATSYGDHTYTLSAGEANSITDYDDLRLRITCNLTGQSCRMTQAYFSTAVGSITHEGILDVDATAEATAWTAEATHNADLAVAGSGAFAADGTGIWLGDLAVAGAATKVWIGTAVTRVTGPDIRPDAVISNVGTWTEVGPGTTLWEAIDEETEDDDTSYITVTAVGDSECEVGLEGVVDPVAAVDHVIHIRGKMVSGTGTIKVELMDGTTIRATLSATALATSYGDHTYTLSAGEANSITDYDDLRLRITHNSVGNECRITQAYFSVASGTTTHEGILDVDAVATATAWTAEATLNADLAVAGSGAFAALAEATLNADLAVAGSAVFAALGEDTHNADLAVAGSGAFAALAEATLNADLAVAGSAAFAADGTGIWTGDLPVAGSAVFAALAEATLNADLAVTGTGAFAALAEATLNADLAVTGTGAFAALAEATLNADLAVAGAATLAALAEATLNAILAVTGTGALEAIGDLTIGGTTHEGILPVAGSAVFVALAEATLNADLAVAGAATFAADGTGIWLGDLAVAGSGAFVALAEATLNADLAVTGTAAFAAIGEDTHNADLVAAGTGAFAALAEATLNADLAVAGAAAFAAAGKGIWTGDLPVAGSAVFAALGEDTHNAILAITADGTLEAIGEATLNADLAVAGAATKVWTGTVISDNEVFGILPVAGAATALWDGTVRTPAIMSLSVAATFAGTPTLGLDRIGGCVLDAAASFGVTGTGNTLGSWVAPGNASLAALGNVAVTHEAVWS